MVKGVIGQKEEKKEKFLHTDGRTNQPKVAQEVLADLKSFFSVREYCMSFPFIYEVLY